MGNTAPNESRSGLINGVGQHGFVARHGLYTAEQAAAADATTFRVLPWADHTGWMLCDVYFSNGQPMPLDGRGLMRRMLGELRDAGYDFLAGIEVEYYIVRLGTERIMPENAGFTPPPPDVSVFEKGYQFRSEVRLDSMADTVETIRDGLSAIGLAPRSMEDEWGPGQVEVSFSPICC